MAKAEKVTSRSVRASRFTFFVLLLLSSPLGAQRKERSISSFDWAGAKISVSASGDLISVDVWGRGVDYVAVRLDQNEAQRFADSVEATMKITPPPMGARESLKWMVESTIRPRSAGITFTREARGTGSTLSLFFSDEYVVNTVYLNVSQARVTAFLRALRTGIKDATELGNQQALTQPFAAFYDWQVDEKAKPLFALRMPFPEKMGSQYSDFIMVELAVDATGTPIPPSFKPLDQKARPELVEAVRNVFSTWRYQPARRGGRAVPQTVTETIWFDPAR